MSPVERLKALRHALAMSQRELAAHLGVAASAIAQWELGDYPIPGPVLKLIEHYEVELALTDERPHLPQGGARRREWVALLLLSPILHALDARGTHWLRHKLVESYAKRLAKMRGVAMKVGQLASFMDFVLPAEDVERLRTLQQNARPMSDRALRATFVAELGAAPTHVFADWSPTPFAVGSIGQVHRAVTHAGVPVAVKIQQPWISDTIDDDMRGLKLIYDLIEMFMPMQAKGVLHQRVREVVRNECDYEREAQAIGQFTQWLAPHTSMRVPNVHHELSTKKILTLDFMTGRTFAQFCAEATGADRARVGRTIWEFYQRTTIGHRCFNTDPNPLNFLFTTDQVVFLDFGQHQTLSTDFQESIKRLMRAAAERDFAAFRTALLATGTVAAVASFDFHQVWRAFLVFFRPWLGAEPFHFDAAYVREMWRVFATENPNFRFISYTEDMPFLLQFYFGVASLLARMEARCDCRPVMMELLYDAAAARPPPFSLDELRLLAL